MERKNNPQRRPLGLLCLLLAATFLLSACSAGPVTEAGGGEGTAPAPSVPSGQEAVGSKQEIIYVNLLENGSVDWIYVVNQFQLDQAGRIVDHGAYSALQNLTTSDDIVFEDQTVTIDTAARTLQYQGTLDHKVLPWLVNIVYRLDGQEVDPKQLGGKSGALEIAVDVTQNPDCSSDFFESYVLQLSLALDMDSCQNVTAEGATLAYAGSNLQLSYTLMPGRESSNRITADVTDFSFSGITIAGVHMSMDVDIAAELDANPEFKDSMQELKDAGVEFDDGANELADGIGEAADGAQELSDGVRDLLDGTQQLTDGIPELTDGIGDLADGAGAMADGVGALVDGNQSIYDGMALLYDGLDVYFNGVDDLYDGTAALLSGANRLSSGLDAVAAQNANLQMMSNALYGQTLQQSAAGLAAAGYTVAMDTTAEALAGMLAQRQGELTSPEAQAAASAQAVTDRCTALTGIVMGGGTAEMTAEEAGARLAYWQAMGSGGDPSPYLAYAESENTIVQAAVTAALTAAVSGDPIYQALGVLSYYKGVIAYTDGVAQLAAGADGVAGGISSARSGIWSLRAGAMELRDSTGEMLDGIQALIDGTAELESGTIELRDGLLTLKDGVLEFSDGSTELVDGVAELYDGTISLCDGLIQIRDGAILFCDGTAQFRDGVSDIDVQFKDSIQEAMDDMFGGDYEAHSFVSPENENTTFVQFAMQTPAIEAPDAPEAPEEPEEELGFFDRLLALFRPKADSAES